MDKSPNPPALLGRLWLVLLGAIITLAGLFFAVGGGKLVSLGGSWYFLLAGVGLVIAGLLIIRRKPVGALLFGLVFVLSVIWAIWDAGFEFWPLISRLLAIAVGSIVVALSFPLLRRSAGRTPAYGASFGLALILAIGTGAAFYGMFIPHPPVVASGAGPARTPVDPAREQKNWEAYGNTSGGSRFAALDQINVDNVNDLKVAWEYHTGDTPISPGANGAEDQETPLQVGDRVFVCTPHNNVISIDADTGKEIWKTEINAKSSVWMRCRGLAYFDATRALEQPSAPNSTPVTAVNVAPGALCERRILMNTITAELIALDADTGAFCPDFGTNGRVDLKVGMGQAADPSYVLTSAPTLAGTTVVVGGRVADNVSTDMPGGVMRGFDVVTGQLRWAFDPGNPNITLLPPPGESYTRSTPNVWASMSYDPASNTVFMPVGSPSVDLYGATRTDLDHKYGASMLALDATTGREKWVYQTVHNDLWDFDVPMQPSFIDFPKADGTTVPALVFGTKAGQLYVLDRATGQPLTKVDDVPVKPGNIPNEPYAPTQKLSVGMPQIGAKTLTESDMWGATPFDQLLCRIAFKGMRYDGVYTVPGTDLALNFPGSLGGMNWGGLSTDPNSNYIFVNDMRLGLWIQMKEAAPTKAVNSGGESVNTGMGLVPMKGTPYAVDKNRFLSALGIPCQAPPFGSLTAIDMKTQKIAWQVPVGTVEDTGPLGIKMGLPIPIGMPTLGGTLATQGGLIFIAGTQDFYLRAFSTATGKEVWKARLPVGSQGGPMTYKSPKTGKQYVIISAGGARQSDIRGDYVIAYALPN
ncbi:MULTISPECIES: glucose/quinate/shikimate family membrane-bound PQQ-dependent dehydrogenase [unclassified Rhizobium]|uniref:glucose/quinate/shikimate family membrane-bound PQQ-dependent dehydrogenase n=1 Tax=unclassified Rhizobium TaxID=2613769 RepID=UPI001ADC03A7|nr:MULTISPECIES: glucose/quinate/shikimate family membrane-bound PQQ-dependent dehydrogenase [unclassified Rhizobium]MBO9127449.1 glucose/quinate/shikimate family membrane-bound PQQ-dependent dehydrogenase [Rhizobium sp. 16-488-2b]MBO9177892.1 glucose/quinate/shikimate family membrane-bound PQQ-dependent dehydrogenase [Rhizobium sp. 16-488-2a]